MLMNLVGINPVGTSTVSINPGGISTPAAACSISPGRNMITEPPLHCAAASGSAQQYRTRRRARL
jgi:hypothetical protein